jgi:hypothetical protein
MLTGGGGGALGLVAKKSDFPGDCTFKLAGLVGLVGLVGFGGTIGPSFEADNCAF